MHISIPETKARAALSLWTPERMTQARPLPMPRAFDSGQGPATVQLPEDARPGYSLGWNPRSRAAAPDPLARYEISPEEMLRWEREGLLPEAVASLGTPPSNPLDFPRYGRFARWTWYGSYLTWPTSTLGKLFMFSPGGGLGVCSATVIGRSTIATAGHCLSTVVDGVPTWFEDVVFCPSFYRGEGNGAPHPARGCWPVVMMATSGPWLLHENVDRDYACAVLAPFGSVHNTKVGEVTGWVGRTWNWPAVQSTLVWGYPSDEPFPGYHLILAAANEWYSINMSNAGEGTVDLPSKYVGSDMTPGASGGGWWLGASHANPLFNYPDSDGVTYTGWVGGPWLNGVNSHKRCFNANCDWPPTATGGIFWQEIGSPQFTFSASDRNDSEDVFAVCLAHPNNNP